MAHFSQGHALVIGVGSFERSPNWNAPITVRDAEAVAAALQNATIAGYPADQVRLLTGSDAGRLKAIAALERLAEKVKPTDTVFLFLSSHGLLDRDGRYNFATHDTVFLDDRTCQAGTGVSQPELLGLLKKIKAGKVLLIVNTCYAGAADVASLNEAESLGAPPSGTFAVDVLGTGAGRAFLLASRPNQRSWFRRGGQHTFFGEALLKALRGEGLRCQGGCIRLFELYESVYRSVRAAAQAYKMEQHPVLTVMQSVGPFPVALYRGSDVGSLAVEEELAEALPEDAEDIELVPARVVEAAQGRAMRIGTGRDLVVNTGNTAINMGEGNTFGNLSFGDVAGGDVIKVSITTTQAANAKTNEELAPLIEGLRGDVENLRRGPEGLREDAADALRRAERAALKGDTSRVREKLQLAARSLRDVGSPEALALADVAGTLLQRVLSSR